ncbi:MAG: Bax inhibitor-1/YccA family protein [Sedimentisphaeraceae bacterium JB056]
MFKTSNPVLKSDYFNGSSYAVSGTRTMTIQGTVTKTMVLLAIAFATGAYTWNMITSGNGAQAMSYAMVGCLGGFAIAVFTCFARQYSMVTAPLYAALEGLALGAISSLFNQKYSGIAMQAVVLTMSVAAVMLIAYKTGMIRPTRKFVAGVVSATGAICLFYIISMIGRVFGFEMPLIHSSGTFGIIFSLVVVVVAALNLILDFAFIEMGEKNGAPKYMEWYGAFSLMVTLVWLYLEILRLLAKLNRN